MVEDVEGGMEARERRTGFRAADDLKVTNWATAALEQQQPRYVESGAQLRRALSKLRLRVPTR